MGQTAPPTRQNRTITVDFRDETTYFALVGNPKAFVEFVLAFLLAIGFQLLHKGSCSERGRLTRHSHYVRVRLDGLTIWRIQCTRCKAVFTVLPHFVLRYRSMRPAVARNALLTTHGGLSLELCAVLYHISPMALYRLVCAFGHHSLVTVLTRCGLPLPVYFLADETHSKCLTDRVYLPTIVHGRVLWHLGYTEEASAVAFTQSYQAFQGYPLNAGHSMTSSTSRGLALALPSPWQDLPTGQDRFKEVGKRPPKETRGRGRPIRRPLIDVLHGLLHLIAARRHAALILMPLGQQAGAAFHGR